MPSDLDRKARELCSKHYPFGLGAAGSYVMVEDIAAALHEARRKALKEAARRVLRDTDEYPRDSARHTLIRRCAADIEALANKEPDGGL